MFCRNSGLYAATSAGPALTGNQFRRLVMELRMAELRLKKASADCRELEALKADAERMRAAVDSELGFMPSERS